MIIVKNVTLWLIIVHTSGVIKVNKKDKLPLKIK